MVTGWIHIGQHAEPVAVLAEEIYLRSYVINYCYYPYILVSYHSKSMDIFRLDNNIAIPFQSSSSGGYEDCPELVIQRRQIRNSTYGRVFNMVVMVSISDTNF